MKDLVCLDEVNTSVSFFLYFRLCRGFEEKPFDIFCSKELLVSFMKFCTSRLSCSKCWRSVAMKILKWYRYVSYLLFLYEQWGHLSNGFGVTSGTQVFISLRSIAHQSMLTEGGRQTSRRFQKLQGMCFSPCLFSTIIGHRITSFDIWWELLSTKRIELWYN